MNRPSASASSIPTSWRGRSSSGSTARTGPAAAVQLFKLRIASAPAGIWIHSFSSLSPETLAAERDGRTVWNPRALGVDFKPVPGAPEPAESPTQRSRQMRALAQGFRAMDDFRKQGWRELRLLPTPIARYGNGKPGTKVLDGALFAFAEGTDPEVFLFLEARRLDQATEWQYALAPMTVFAVKSIVSREDGLGSSPIGNPRKTRSRPFFDLRWEVRTPLTDSVEPRGLLPDGYHAEPRRSLEGPQGAPSRHCSGSAFRYSSRSR